MGCKPGSTRDGNNEVADVSFDPSSLLSIEAITVDSDIRAFLHSRVPGELTRAALRRAWVSDPAIRDFIGIAESQWDFNDANAIPGFGPLRGTDNVASLLEQMLGDCDKFTGAFPETPAYVKQAPPASNDSEPADLDPGEHQRMHMLPAPRYRLFAG